MQRRKRTYIVMMSVCLLLFALAGMVVRHVSVPAAIVMAVVAMIIPPFAVMVANTRDPDDPEDNDPYDSQDDPRP